MGRIQLTWVEGQRYLGVDSTNHSVVLSGGDDVGVRPSEALLLALAGCSAYDVVEIIRKQRAELRRLRVVVTGEQAPDPPWPYRRIHLRYEVVAAGSTVERVTRAADLALNTYCSVRASLSPEIDVTFEVALLDE